MCFENKYCIEPRVKKRLFRDPTVVYDIFQIEKVHYFSMSGGYWAEESKKVVTLASKEDAEDMLSKLTGGVDRV